jgi:hypothetical protein
MTTQTETVPDEKYDVNDASTERFENAPTPSGHSVVHDDDFEWTFSKCLAILVRLLAPNSRGRLTLS